MRLRDWSQPCFWGSCIFGTVSIVYSAIVGAGYWIAASVCLCCTGTLGAQRTYSLGLAKSLGDSADAFKEENTRLLENNEQMKVQVGELAVQVDDLRGINGLLDGTEQDLREVETKLRTTYQAIRNENQKHQNNNLVSLFTLVDKDGDGELSKEEVERLDGFVVAVYDKRIDFPALDSDGDGSLTLPEFITLFNK